MECVFLGTGYSVNTPERHNTSLFLREKQAGLLIDCNGVCIQRLRTAGYAFENLEHVFLTHEHIDHIGALANLTHQIWIESVLYRPENKRLAPLNFYANARTLGMIRQVFGALGLMESPGLFPLRFHELDYDGGDCAIDVFNITYFPVSHGGTPCFGLSIGGEKRGLVYSADTEPVPRIYSHLQPGDLLIHECNRIDAAVNPGHTTWAQLEALLPSLPSAEMYLVHLPAMAPQREEDFRALLPPNVRLADDGLVLSF